MKRELLEEGIASVQEDGAILSGVPSENADLETTALSTDPRFIALIECSRTRQRAEGGISSAEMRRRLAVS